MGITGPRTHLSPTNFRLGITDFKGHHRREKGIQRMCQHLPGHQAVLSPGKGCLGTPATKDIEPKVTGHRERTDSTPRGL